MIPYGRQDITDEDIQSVVDVLKSDFLTQGPQIEALEKKFAAYCGSKYCVAVSSCTAGLHLACLALGLKKDDVMWTVPNTFVASANCGLYCAASVDFVDIDPVTWNMSPKALKEKLEHAATNNALPKIVIPVHFSGRSCDMIEIKKLSQEYGFHVIEDAAHSIGASYNNKAEKTGSCLHSDMAVFSTHPVKIVTTGEGGLITTNNPDLYQKLLRLRTHGITKSPDLMKNEPNGPWYFEQQELGYHYRMTDIHAALGISQIDRIDRYVEARRDIARRYISYLSDLPITLPAEQGLELSSWHLFVIRLNLNVLAKTHREIFKELRSAGIGVNLHYIPVHLHPYYQGLGFKAGAFQESEQYYKEAITLPLYPSLSNNDFEYICKKMKEILS